MSSISNVPAVSASTGNLILGKPTLQPGKPAANPSSRADQALFTRRPLQGTAFEPMDAPLLSHDELLANAQTAMLAQANSSPSGVLALLSA
jgi:hypothetical protein